MAREEAAEQTTRPELPGQASVTIVRDDVQFDARDAALLATIDETGSVNKASASLGRSHARALKRIDALEVAFGELVSRTRGGTGGGGSQLTDTARVLLDRYARLNTAVAAEADASETVLAGTVTDVDGELASVDTAIGTVRGVHAGLQPGEDVQIRIASDALTVHTPDDVDPDRTSARNRVRAPVKAIESGTTIHTLTFEVAQITFRAIVTTESMERMDIEVGSMLELNWKATATRLVERTGHDA